MRELGEELGLTSEVEEVLRVAACEATDYEHVTLFKVVADSQPVLNEAELHWGGFMKRDTLSRLIENNPRDFVPAFILLWKEFLRRSQ